MNALKSQYEGRLSRQERELRDLREQQERHGEQRDESAEQGSSKVTSCDLSIANVQVNLKWSSVYCFLLSTDPGTAKDNRTATDLSEDHTSG